MPRSRSPRRVKKDKKLELHMLGGMKITAEHIAKMYESLTGKPYTEADKQRAQAMLDKRYRELEAQ
jgi:hypothetical protein